jgi:hypothetical protein
MHSGYVSSPYRFESGNTADRVIENALEYMSQLENRPPAHMDPETVERIFDEISGLLPALKNQAAGK